MICSWQDLLQAPVYACASRCVCAWLCMCLQGTGASPDGNRPFLDLLDLGTRETRRLWQSSAPFYSQPGSIFNDLDHVSGPHIREWAACFALLQDMQETI